MKPLKSQSTRIKNKIGRQKRREKGRKEAKKKTAERGKRETKNQGSGTSPRCLEALELVAFFPSNGC
jgi:hypothetical protein